MNSKTTLILVVSLILALGGVWWAQESSKPNDEDEKQSGPQSLFDFEAGNITAYELKVGSESTCSFEKRETKWHMTMPIAGPAQHGFVTSDINTLAGLEYQTQYAKGHADRPSDDLTSLARPRRIVKLTDDTGKSHVLKIGARQKLSTRTYVQKEGDETIYLVDSDLNKSLRRKLSDYRGKRVCEFQIGDAVRIEASGTRQYTLVKSGATWTLESPVKARAAAAEVSKILRAISNLSVSSYVDDDPKTLRPYRLDSPQMTVAITTEKRTPKPAPAPPASQPATPEFDIETKTIRVAFGGTADKMVFAKLAETDSKVVFQVAQSVLEGVAVDPADLRDKKLADLQPQQAQEIKLTAGGASVELRKEGVTWRIASGPVGDESSMAEYVAVDDLLKAVRDLKAIGFVDSISSEQGFEAPRATLEITAEGRVEPIKFVIGAMTPSKTGAYLHSETEGFAAVIKAADADKIAVEPISFLGRSILSFDRRRASRIEIERDGVVRTAQRADETWRFSAPVSGGADETNVNNILSDLAGLRARRIVGLADAAPSFGLDQPLVVATVTVDPQPKPTPTTQPADAQEEGPEPPQVHRVFVSRRGGQVYAMREGGATVGEIDGKVLEDLQAEMLDRQVLTLEPSQCIRLAYAGEADFDFSKDGDTWSLAGESSFEVNATKITEVLSAIRDVRAVSFASYQDADLAQFGLVSPATTIRADSGAQGSLSLYISARGPSGGDRYASVASTPDRVFVLQADDVTKLLKKVTDFQKGS